MQLDFYRQIFEKYQISNFMKIVSVGVELLHAEGRKEGRKDGRTDRQAGRHDEANSRFSKFCERSKNASWNPNDFGHVFLKG